MYELLSDIVYVIACVSLLVLGNILVKKINMVFTKKQNDDIP